MTPGELEAIKAVTSIHRPKKADNVAECAFRDALNRIHIPLASTLLSRIYDACNAALDTGDHKGAAQLGALYFKACGLIKAPKSDAEVEALAKQLLSQMIAEAKARREEP